MIDRANLGRTQIGEENSSTIMNAIIIFVKNR